MRFIIILFAFYSCSGISSRQTIDLEKLKSRAGFYYDQDNCAEAYKCYDSLIQFDSLQPEYLFRRGKCAMTLQKYTQAREDFNKTIGLGYRKASSFYNIGLTYIYTDSLTAFSYFKSALKEDPSHEKAKFMLHNLDSIMRLTKRVTDSIHKSKLSTTNYD
jgi:tetratricopeptide (TPR) repeat protein